MKLSTRNLSFGAAVLATALITCGNFYGQEKTLPDHLVPRRSSQIKDGFGINSDLPRDPYIPWNRWWWTRMFDAGVSFIRIGQYENSSDYTSWDWVERKRGEYALPAGTDDYVNSLVENGLHIEIQLLYGNPLYTSPAGRAPDSTTPEPGSFHNPDRSIYSAFWPPKTPDQIAAFNKYVRWMVTHFRGRVPYYEIWNEPNIDYWNPHPSPEEYGHLFKSVIPVIHEADPSAKIIFGALAGADRDYAKRALDACDCAAGIDVFAYHVYPNYGHNLNPEAMDDAQHASESPKALRDMVRAYPGIRADLAFWDDEFNDGLATWTNSDESVQAKYIPRGMLLDRAAGVRTFVWLIVGATDGNEADDFGMLHGLMQKPNDFTARPAFEALQNTNTLFSDTQVDTSIQVSAMNGSRSEETAKLLSYGFRGSNNKAVVAYWLPVLSQPGNRFPTEKIDLQIRNSGIQHPVLVDITSGAMTRMFWKSGTLDTLEQVPLKDSVIAVADESFFDWAALPDAPSELEASAAGTNVRLTWKLHGGLVDSVVVERRSSPDAKWQQISQLSGGAMSFEDRQRAASQKSVAYRVCARNSGGKSAYSNIAGIAK